MLKQEIAKHCVHTHGWVNPSTRGRPVLKKAPAAEKLMWEAGVSCQRFRNCGARLWAFRVAPAVEDTAVPVPQPPARAGAGRTWGELEAKLDMLQSNSTAWMLLGLGASS
jgi:hypothetical protein